MPVPDKLRSVLPAGQNDLDIVVLAFALVIKMQTLSEKMGVNPHDCICLRIEIGRAAQSFHGNVVFLQAGRFPLKMLLADIGENAGEIRSPLKQSRGLHSLKLRAFTGERIKAVIRYGSGRHGLAPKLNVELFVQTLT
jgi:hypothetical protein